jgi:hypothetical protein
MWPWIVEALGRVRSRSITLGVTCVRAFRCLGEMTRIGTARPGGVRVISSTSSACTTKSHRKRHGSGCNEEHSCKWQGVERRDEVCTQGVAPLPVPTPLKWEGKRHLGSPLPEVRIIYWHETLFTFLLEQARAKEAEHELFIGSSRCWRR